MNALVDVNWELILDFLQALAWPVVAVGGLFVFRRQIRAWLGRQPSSIATPFGTVTWSQPEVDVDPEEAIAPYEDADFVEAIRDEIRAEVIREVAGVAAVVNEEQIRDLARATVNLEFEQIFNRIFGSQVLLLERLRDGDKDEHYMVAWFNGVVQKYPAMAAAGFTKDSYSTFSFTTA